MSEIEISAQLRRLMENRWIDTRVLLGAAAKACEVTIVRHFRARPSRSGFFTAAVDGKVTTRELTSEQATVAVDSRELAHYIGGGEVRPIPPGRTLAIPLTDRARKAGSPSLQKIPHLHLVPRKGKPPLLCTTQGESLEAHYVLVPRVEHTPHPEAWPEQAITEATRAAITQNLSAQISASK